MDTAAGGLVDACHICHADGAVNVVGCGKNKCVIKVCAGCVEVWRNYGMRCTLCGDSPFSYAMRGRPETYSMWYLVGMPLFTGIFGGGVMGVLLGVTIMLPFAWAHLANF